ncbi:MAG TPA: DUF2007 domain-containing protein [Thermoanaerobaculia bacterium]|nr:DUF2007 domain-containing protein [Thermoanaerobaculia bacterium]
MILMATIARLTPEEAHLLQGRLEAEQVSVSIHEDHNAGLPVAGGSTAGVSLEVPDEQAGRAREILRQIAETEAEADTPQPDPARLAWLRFGDGLELVLFVLFLAAACIASSLRK